MVDVLLENPPRKRRGRPPKIKDIADAEFHGEETDKLPESQNDTEKKRRPRKRSRYDDIYRGVVELNGMLRAFPFTEPFSLHGEAADTTPKDEVQAFSHLCDAAQQNYPSLRTVPDSLGKFSFALIAFSFAIGYIGERKDIFLPILAKLPYVGSFFTGQPQLSPEQMQEAMEHMRNDPFLSQMFGSQNGSTVMPHGSMETV